MDFKALIQSPETGIRSLTSNGEVPLAELEGKVKRISFQRNELKAIKRKKAAVAREFKRVHPDAVERQTLLARMRQVSEAYKAAESQLKAEERALRKLIETLSSEPEQAPPFYKVTERDHSGAYTIAELSPGDMNRWYQFVAEQPNAPVYCRSGWTQVAETSFGHPTRVWVALTPKGEIVGGIPLVFVKTRLFGRYAVSLPHVNYGGLLTPYRNVARSILNRLQRVCEQEKLSHIEVRSMQPDLWHTSVEKKVSMVLRLPETEAALQKQLSAKVRSQSKKAERYKPIIRFGRLALLDDFYQVFATNMRDLGTPVYAKSWFRGLLARADLDTHLVVVYVDEQPKSAAFLVGCNGMLEIPWAATIKTANAMDSNMWMYRQILQFAVRGGYQFFDFGRSTKDSGTYRFKKQWGAVAYPHYWHYVLPSRGVVPQLNPDNPKFRLLIEGWKRMPVWLTRFLGPSLVRGLS